MSLTSFFRFYLKRNLKRNVAVASFQKNYSSNTNQHVIRSKAADVVIPNITLDEEIWKDLGKWYDKTAMVCAETGRSYLYSDVYKKSGVLANFLHKFKGINQGDTIAMVLPNVPEYGIILIGGIQAGLKVTTVNPLYGPEEMARQFVDSGTKLIFTLNQLWPNVNSALRSSKSDKDIHVVIINTQQNESIPQGTIKFDEITQGDHQIQFNIKRTPDDVILLPYSSGTTGHPKGVQLMNRNMVTNIKQSHSKEFKIIEHSSASYQEIIPAILPMFHIYGMSLTLNCMAVGSKLITLSKFSSELFIDVLENHRPTIAFLVPPLILLLINHPGIGTKHLENLKRVASGAAPLGAADVERFYKKTDEKILLVQGYGLTEASPLTHYQTDKIPKGIKIGGCGMVVPNTECKVMTIDDDKSKRVPLGPNQPGELYVRGPQIMKGYHNNPQATEEIIDSEGWLQTGDICYYDEDEHFFITDRLKELIKVKGFQVPPAELEEILRDHPSIQDAAVIGVYHKDFGEVPKAFVVRKKDVDVNPATIQEYVASKVVKYKQLLGGVAFIDSIPKNATGKILRRQLKEMDG